MACLRSYIEVTHHLFPSNIGNAISNQHFVVTPSFCPLLSATLICKMNYPARDDCQAVSEATIKAWRQLKLLPWQHSEGTPFVIHQVISHAFSDITDIWDVTKVCGCSHWKVNLLWHYK